MKGCERETYCRSSFVAQLSGSSTAQRRRPPNTPTRDWAHSVSRAGADRGLPCVDPSSPLGR